MIDLMSTASVTLLVAGIDHPALPQRRRQACPDRMLADLVTAHGGVRQPTRDPDDVVVAFTRAGDAITCAVELQRAPLAPMRLRIAVDIADTAQLGPAITRAGRLRDLAHGGQIVLSARTEALVADRLPTDVWLIALGRYHLPDLPPVRVAQVCHPDLVNEFPPLRAAEPTIRGDLPAQLTSFIGRRRELAELHRLTRDHRLVTLTGSGGVGKTRLAAQLANELAAGDGVWWVDLAPITDPDLVAVRIARSLDLPDQPGSTAADTLVRFIGRRDLVVVLDNCEHLLDPCAGLVNGLLGVCAGVRIVATSREPLGVAGEVTWHTPSLSLADEAIELFTDRARLNRPDFTLTDDNAAPVAEICRRLDGVALAIELAAVRVRTLSLNEIADGLNDRFRLLTGGVRAAMPRQQTLHASVDWSHALLSEREQIVFRRLAVFLGGFDIAAATAVAGDPDVPRCQMRDELCLLVSKSLVECDNTGPASRYRLLETIRDHALGKLADAGEADTVRTRHRDHYAALFATPLSVGFWEHLDRAETEIDNLRAAFAFSLTTGDTESAARLASCLQPLWVRGRITEGLGWFDAIDAADTVAGARHPVLPGTRARMLADRLILHHLVGTLGCLEEADRALAIARDLDDTALLAWVLAACGCTRLFMGGVALPYFAEAVELSRGVGDDWQLCQILGWQALSAFVAGDPAAALAAGEAGRALADAIGEDSVSRLCGWCIGLARWLTADLAEAAEQLTAVVAEAHPAHHLLIEAVGSQALGMVRAYQGDAEGSRAAASAAVEAAAVLAVGFHRGTSFGALADAALAAGDVDAAVTAGESGWRACEQVELLAINCDPLAEATLAAGDAAAALRWIDDALAVAAGAHRMVLLATRVRVAMAQGNPDQAQNDAADALALATEHQAYLNIPDVFECLAELAVGAQRHRDAARLFGAAQSIRDRTGQVRFTIYDARYAATVGALRDAMGDTAFDSAWSDGAAVSIADVIASAQRVHPRSGKGSAGGWASLTRAERDVVRLLGEGLCNKDIAARLVVSPRTVQTHLTHVYTKLGVKSRVQLVQEAARHG